MDPFGDSEVSELNFVGKICIFCEECDKLTLSIFCSDEIEYLYAVNVNFIPVFGLDMYLLDSE